MWDEFEDYDVDFVVIVCDLVVGELCFVYFGKFFKVYWGLEDLFKLEGSE